MGREKEKEWKGRKEGKREGKEEWKGNKEMRKIEKEEVLRQNGKDERKI